jgi:glycosyltransferase involved in cell wall biosynthesis
VPTLTLIVFSHLRWNFVFQRPQHLLTRLAAHYQVLFIEEPAHAAGAPRLEVESGDAGVTIIRPLTACPSAGFADDQLALLGPMLADYLCGQKIEEYMVWFYTPMALPLLDRLAPLLVVYDCMDELSAFAGAPPQLRQREAELLGRADLVLTGGPSLYRAKKHFHPHVLCLPSSVDAAHFSVEAKVDDAAMVEFAHRLQGQIPAPRLGYFGVIDERMDLDLVRRLADADPAWSIVMVGPVVKIDPRSIPRRPNLHWLGQQPYEALPRLIEGWQVGLLPFALNASTRFISPTKTLEYMAAGKPAVSTAIKDVAILYGDVVRIAHSPDDFVAACAAALEEGPSERCARLLAMQASVSRSSWTATANTIHAALQVKLAALAARKAEPVRVAQIA